MQRAAVMSGGEFRIGLSRLCERRLAQDEDERIQRWVARRDGVQARLGGGDG
jgi:hypothetical protein